MPYPAGFVLSLLPVLLTLLWVWLQVCFDATDQANPDHVAAFRSLYQPFFTLFLAITLCAWLYITALFTHTTASSAEDMYVRIVLSVIHLLAALLAFKFFRQIRALVG